MFIILSLYNITLKCAQNTQWLHLRDAIRGWKKRAFRHPDVLPASPAPQAPELRCPPSQAPVGASSRPPWAVSSSGSQTSSSLFSPPLRYWPFTLNPFLFSALYRELNPDCPHFSQSPPHVTGAYSPFSCHCILTAFFLNRVKKLVCFLEATVAFP